MKAEDASKACAPASASQAGAADKAADAFKAPAAASTLIVNARLVDAGMDCTGSLLVAGGLIAGVFPDEVEYASGSLSGAECVDKASAAFKTCGALSAAECASGSLSGASSTDEAVSAFKAAGGTVIDAHGLAVMPAFVDMHVHFRDPGQTQKEDIISGSDAAAAAGTGTVVLMPNTAPVVSSGELALANNKKAADTGKVRAIQVVSITRGFDGKDTTHIDEALACYEKARGTAESAFVPPVPVFSEDGKDVADEAVMRSAMKKIAAAGAIVSCHCEEPSLVPAARDLRSQKKFAEAEKVLADAENSCTERNIQIALETGCRIHIAHASTAVALEAVRRAKQSESGRALVTCEVTPHHLGLSQDMSGFESELVNPPLRPEADRKAVLAAIVDGTADVISTDHAPHTMQDKADGACGFTGLETAFAVCNETLVQSGLITLSKLSSLMSAKPAELLGLKAGRLVPGYAADLVFADCGQKWTVEPASFKSRGKYTPLAGKTLTGRIVKTLHAGKVVYEE